MLCCTILPPTLHRTLPGWAPAGPCPPCSAAARTASLAAVLGQAGRGAASLFHIAPQEAGLLPSNTSEAVTTRRWLLLSTPSPLFSPLRETKGEGAAKAVTRVIYDSISPIYGLMIQASGLENGGADGLVLLTSSCRMAAGGSRAGAAKALLSRWLRLSRELSKVTRAVSPPCDLSGTRVSFLP